MLGRLALLFIVIPILELWILVRLGQEMGFWPTFGLVMFSGVLGAVLTRTAGLRLLTSIRSELAAGRIPSQALMDGLAILAGGAFLLTPGLITDVIGFALLFTPTRKVILKQVASWLERQVREGKVQVGTLGPDGVSIRTSTHRGPVDMDP